MHYGNGTRQQAAGGAWGAHPVSKVVDAQGKPLVVYHGTGADFSVFDGKKRGSHTREVDARQGFFLSSSPEIASEYAEEAGANGGANIMPAYVSLQNPLVIDEGGRDYDPIRFRNYIEQAQEQGHDGVLLRNTGDGMFKNGRTGDTVIAFRPEQIKSATGNNGNFDPANPDITNFATNPARRPGSAQDKAVMQAIADGKSARDVLRLVASGSKDPFLRQVARLLLKAGITPNIQFGHIGKTEKGDPIHGQYRGKSDTIAIAGSAEYAAERIFMHEAMHAATMRALKKPGLPKLQLQKLLEHVRKQGGAAGFYGLKNVDEFVAEVFTNPDFQNALRTMRAPAGSPLKSAWHSFVQVLRRILGLGDNSTNVLSQALELGVAAVREDMGLRKRGMRMLVDADVSKARILQGEPVARINTVVAPKGAPAIRAWAAKVFAQQGGVAQNPELGAVLLDERSIRSSMAHGRPNEYKVAAFAAVKDVLERGALVLSAQHGRDGESFYVSAPVQLGQTTNIVTVLVKRDPNSQRMYLHSVATKEYLLSHRVSRTDTASGVERSGSNGSGDAATVATEQAFGKASAEDVASELHRLLRMDVSQEFTVSKARDQKDAPPHGTSGNGMPGISDRSVLQPSSGGGSIVGESMDSGQDGVANFGVDDIARIKASAIDRVHQTMTHPGKMSLWDKTVGTMRHISERYPAFKPVYDAAQQFIDDVASLANMAANVAPRLIPRVDSLRDMFKKPISVDDNKAIAKALFEGTLDWGRDQHGKAMPMDELRAKYAGLNAHQKAEVLLAAGKVNPQVMTMWRGQKIEQFETLIHNKFESAILKPGTEFSDKELKEFFNLNGEQISLYKEARATVAKSLDITARAEMMRYVGHDFGDLRAQVLDAPSLTEAWKVLDSALEAKAKELPDSRDLMADKMFQLRAIVDKVQDLLDHGYMPLSRFGKYTLEVIDQDGERVYFGLFEREADSNRMALQMRNVYKGAKVTQGTMNDEKYKLFAGITPETAELFGNMLGLDEEGQDAKSKAFQEYLRMAKNNHSALKRLIHRKGTAGYSEDVGRVLASFVYSNARLAATGLNAGRMESAIHRLNTEHKEEGELGKIAMKLREYIQDPQEEGMWLRGMLLGVGACTTETAPGNRRRAAPGGLIRYGCSTAQLLNTRC